MTNTQITAGAIVTHAYAINERVSENEFKRVGLIDEIVDVGTKV